MKYALWTTLLLAGLFAGCETTPPPDVVSRTDEVTGRQSHLITDNVIAEEKPSGSELSLNASQLFTYRSEAKYYLEVRFQALPERGLIEIGPGRTLTITVDGVPLNFTGPGSAKFRRERFGTVIENAVYSVELAQMDQIAHGKDVKVKVSGAKGFVERTFGPKNYENFRQFVQQVRASASGTAQ